MNRKRLSGSEDFAWGAAIVDSGMRILRGPFQQDGVVGMPRTVRKKIGLGFDVGCIGVGIKLPVTRRTALIELGVKGKTLEAAVMTARLDVHSPIGGVHIKEPRDSLSVITDRVDRSCHQMDKKTMSSRFVDQHHHARRCGPYV